MPPLMRTLTPTPRLSFFRCDTLVKEGEHQRCLTLCLELTASLPVPEIALPIDAPAPDETSPASPDTTAVAASPPSSAAVGFYAGWGSAEAGAFGRLNRCLVSCLHGLRVEQAPAEVALAAYQNALAVYHVCRLQRKGGRSSSRLESVNIDVSAFREAISNPAADPNPNPNWFQTPQLTHSSPIIRLKTAYSPPSQPMATVVF